LLNMTGNISAIHWYHRTRIREEDRIPYGRCVGGGTAVIGLGIIAAAGSELLFAWPYAEVIVGSALVIGIWIILYGQFKYNGGLF